MKRDNTCWYSTNQTGFPLLTQKALVARDNTVWYTGGQIPKPRVGRSSRPRGTLSRGRGVAQLGRAAVSKFYARYPKECFYEQNSVM
jgi:hypothetical protein